MVDDCGVGIAGGYCCPRSCCGSTEEFRDPLRGRVGGGGRGCNTPGNGFGSGDTDGAKSSIATVDVASADRCAFSTTAVGADSSSWYP